MQDEGRKLTLFGEDDVVAVGIAQAVAAIKCQLPGCTQVESAVRECARRLIFHGRPVECGYQSVQHISLPGLGSLKSAEPGSVPPLSRNIREIFTIGSTQADDTDSLHPGLPPRDFGRRLVFWAGFGTDTDTCDMKLIKTLAIEKKGIAPIVDSF
jgi:hypothetical protein